MNINDNLIYRKDFKIKLANMIEARRENEVFKLGSKSIDYCIDNLIKFNNEDDIIKFVKHAEMDLFYLTAITYIVSVDYWQIACDLLNKSYMYNYNRFSYLLKISSSGKKPAHAIFHTWLNSCQCNLESISRFIGYLPHDLDKFMKMVDFPVHNFEGYNDHKMIAEHHYDKDANPTFGMSLAPGMYFKIYDEHINDIVQTCLQKGMPAKGSHFHPQKSSFYTAIEHDRCNYYYLLSQGYTDSELLSLTYPALAQERPDLLLLSVDLGEVIHYPDLDQDYKKDFGVPFYCKISNGELIIDQELRSICRQSTNHMNYIMRSIHEMIHSKNEDQYYWFQDRMFNHFDHERLIDFDHDHHILHMELDALMSCSGLTEEEYYQIDRLDKILCKIQQEGE